jgi:hypothetical protein
MVASLYVNGATLWQNVPEVVGNPPANLLQGVRRYFQPSDKLIMGYQRVLATYYTEKVCN